MSSLTNAYASLNVWRLEFIKKWQHISLMFLAKYIPICSYVRITFYIFLQFHFPQNIFSHFLSHDVMALRPHNRVDSFSICTKKSKRGSISSSSYPCLKKSNKSHPRLFIFIFTSVEKYIKLYLIVFWITCGLQKNTK